MNVVALLRKLKIINEDRQLELYPPFFLMGVKVVSIDKNYRSIHIRVPLRWYGTNLHGSMFGGFITAVADPFAAILCGRIFSGTEVWTKSQTVDFIKPGRSDLDLKIKITDADIAAIRTALNDHGKAIHTFEYDFTDKDGEIISHVKNVVYLRRTKKKSVSH